MKRKEVKRKFSDRTFFTLTLEFFFFSFFLQPLFVFAKAEVLILFALLLFRLPLIFYLNVFAFQTLQDQLNSVCAQIHFIYILKSCYNLSIVNASEEYFFFLIWFVLIEVKLRVRDRAIKHSQLLFINIQLEVINENSLFVCHRMCVQSIFNLIFWGVSFIHLFMSKIVNFNLLTTNLKSLLSSSDAR